jgi:hypothetical protein
MDDAQATAIIQMARDQVHCLYEKEEDRMMAMIVIVTMLDYLTEPHIYKQIVPGVAVQLKNPFPIGEKNFPQLLRILANIVEMRAKTMEATNVQNNNTVQ